MSGNVIRDYIFENYNKQIGFSTESRFYSMKPLKRKDLLLLANKLIQKVPDSCNAKEHYESFLRKKIRKSVKHSEIITNQPKTFDSVDIKSVIAEHKLSNTIRKDEKLDSNSSLSSDTKERENCLNKKNIKITKREHAFKGYASTYNVEILNSFNPELQLKDTESAIKSNLIELLTQLRGFKFVTTLGLVFKKIESKDKTKYDNFYSSSKAEIIINKRDIENQSILQL